MEIYIGCASWGNPEMLEKFYPEGTEGKDLLRYYSSRFSCVELNPTFHDSISSRTVEKWKADVPEGFKFCPKFPKEITHVREFRNSEVLTRRFYELLGMFGPNLGVSWLQLRPLFTKAYYNDMIRYIENLPEKFAVNVELRGEWFLTNRYNINDLMVVLRLNRKGVVIPDNAETAGYVNKLSLTTDVVLVRFIAYGHKTDAERLSLWAVVLKKWKDQGVKEVYFTVHERDPELKAVRFAQKKFIAGDA